jgi:hypothetical protein
MRYLLFVVEEMRPDFVHGLLRRRDKLQPRCILSRFGRVILIVDKLLAACQQAVDVCR